MSGLELGPRDYITQDEIFVLKDNAASEIASRGGDIDDHIYLEQWVVANKDRFDKIVTDSPNLIRRLADKETHKEAIEEIYQKLYH